MHEDLPSPATPDILGFVDGNVRGQLCGWVYDRCEPWRRLTVAVSDRAGRQMLALADRYRADVHQSGHGDGYYGFVLPTRHLSGVEAVRVVSTQPAVELPDVSSPAAGSPDMLVFTVGSYSLHLDRIGRPSCVSGWAVDTAQPQVRRALQLHTDDRLVGRQRATLHRAEAVNDICDGYHGFLFALRGNSMKSLIVEDVGMGAKFQVWP